MWSGTEGTTGQSTRHLKTVVCVLSKKLVLSVLDGTRQARSRASWAGLVGLGVETAPVWARSETRNSLTSWTSACTNNAQVSLGEVKGAWALAKSDSFSGQGGSGCCGDWLVQTILVSTRVP